MKLALALSLLAPAAAAAQAPPPDERAAAQAFADAAKRLIAAATAIDEDPSWLGSCRALRRDPPARLAPPTARTRGRAIRAATRARRGR